MIVSKMVRANGDDDPRRCTDSYRDGPCPYIAVEHGTKCQMHGGTQQFEKYERQELFKYRAEKWQEKIAHFAEDDSVKSLRQEIGVARMLLEETLNQCKDATELLVYSTKINAMVDQISKLVVNCTKLEDRLGVVIDKSTVLNLGHQVLEIIKEYVPEDCYELVANRIISTISTAGDPLALEYQDTNGG
jgi:hypothetical protein